MKFSALLSAQVTAASRFQQDAVAARIYRWAGIFGRGLCLLMDKFRFALGMAEAPAARGDWYMCGGVTHTSEAGEDEKPHRIELLDQLDRDADSTPGPVLMSWLTPIGHRSVQSWLTLPRRDGSSSHSEFINMTHSSPNTIYHLTCPSVPLSHRVQGRRA